MPELITPDAMNTVAREVISPGRVIPLCANSERKNWATFFGTSPIVAASLWNRIDPVSFMDRNAKPKHLLYALLLLKKYTGDAVHAKVVGCCANTFAYWAWKFIREIYDLHVDVIVWENRRDGWDPNIASGGVTIDCVDCPIAEPWPFDNTWWSQKINGPGLKYMVARSIHNGSIVHWNGPTKPSVPDITILRGDLLNKLDLNEIVEVDSGGGGEDTTKTPSIGKSSKDRMQKSQARAKQENLFSRVKKSRCFVAPFIHSHDKHGLAFGASLVIIQIGFELGTLRQYDLEYEVEYF